MLSLLKPGIPTLLIANKLDNVHRRAEIAPWLQEHAGAPPVCRVRAHVGQEQGDIQRLYGICEKYLPEAPWWYEADELTDRSEKFLASEIVREKLFRFTGDELPYTSTVVIDKFEEEQSKVHKRMMRVAATIIVERDSHKAMVIGDKGERLKRIGTEARQELEKLHGRQGVPGALGQGALGLGRRRSPRALLRLRVNVAPSSPLRVLSAP